MSTWPGRSSDRPPLGGAEYAYSIVYGILTIVVGVVVVNAIGLPKPWGAHNDGGLIAICMLYSLRPFPDRLRDQRFWIKRSIVYLLVNVGAIVLMAYLYSLTNGEPWPMATSIVLTAIIAYLILVVPKLFTERTEEDPRFVIRDVVLAVFFSAFFHLSSLAIDALFGDV